MRIVLCGYHEAGYRALRTLAARGHEVFVATHPSPPEMPCVAALARWFGFPCTEGSLEESWDTVSTFQPDVLFSVYYRAILPPGILALPARGGYNFHPSLLPRHRGSFSGPWAIIEGDRLTGVTCHRMIERVDAGDIVATLEVPITDDSTGMSLYYALVDAAVELLPTVLNRLQTGPLPAWPQVGEGSFHLRRLPFDGLIDPTWPRARIERFIRALDFPPYPPAHVMVDGAARAVRSICEYDKVWQTRQPAVNPGSERREIGRPARRSATVSTASNEARSVR